ncbi:MAG: hypothetical protein ABGZ35_01090, partial [Planctomycetaceae bacterium]
ATPTVFFTLRRPALNADVFAAIITVAFLYTNPNVHFPGDSTRCSGNICFRAVNRSGRIL